MFYPAREAAGRPDLRFHDLRHTGAILAAATGATLAELMARLGHSTPGAAMRYQHAAADRDKVIAPALSGSRRDGHTDRPHRGQDRPAQAAGWFTLLGRHDEVTAAHPGPDQALLAQHR